MTRKFLIALTLLVGAVSALMCVRAIPPNGAVGFRTSASLSSPHAWYTANEIAGRIFLCVSTLFLALALYFKSASRGGNRALAIGFIAAMGAAAAASVHLTS